MKRRTRNSLENMRVALLCTDGVEQSELIEPLEALKAEGAKTSIVSPKEASVQAWSRHSPGDLFDVDVPLDEADPEDFDALVLPGGALNGDQLRAVREAIEFVRHFHQEQKPIAAICHGTWLLADAQLVRRRQMCSAKSLRTDLINAGAELCDESVVIDEGGGGLVTSRCIDDLYDFNRAMIGLFRRELRKRAGEPGERSEVRSRPGILGGWLE